MPLSIQAGKENGFCFIFPIVSGKDNQIVNIFCGCFYIFCNRSFSRIFCTNFGVGILDLTADHLLPRDLKKPPIFENTAFILPPNKNTLLRHIF